MMPMGIASFSFDLFGIARRQAGSSMIADTTDKAATLDHQAISLRNLRDDEDRDLPPKDYEHVFWGMFPVL